MVEDHVVRGFAAGQGDVGDGGQHIRSAHDAPEHVVYVIQVRQAVRGEKILGAIRVLSRVGRGKHAESIVSQARVELIPEGVARTAAAIRFILRPGLHDGRGDIRDTDHDLAIVIRFVAQSAGAFLHPGLGPLGQADKVGDRHRCLDVEKFPGHVAVIGFPDRIKPVGQGEGDSRLGGGPGKDTG